MLVILVACSLLIAVYGAAIENQLQLDGRIVGGHAISITQAPYQAAFEVNGDQQCGAAIISNSFVLCAAHCSVERDVRAVDIRVGSSYRNSGGSVHHASQIINHSGYTMFPTIDNDISLIKVATPFVYSASVRPISLASVVPAAGTSVLAAGWGRTSERGPTSHQLLQIQISIVSNAQCSNAYRGLITNTMVCAMGPGKDTCQQDSGGPLVHGNEVVGVVSWGSGCARDVPGVYANVPAYRSWIKQNSGV